MDRPLVWLLALFGLMATGFIALAALPGCQPARRSDAETAIASADERVRTILTAADDADENVNVAIGYLDEGSPNQAKSPLGGARTHIGRIREEAVKLDRGPLKTLRDQSDEVIELRESLAAERRKHDRASYKVLVAVMWAAGIGLAACLALLWFYPNKLVGTGAAACLSVLVGARLLYAWLDWLVWAGAAAAVIGLGVLAWVNRKALVELVSNGQRLKAEASAAAARAFRTHFNDDTESPTTRQLVRDVKRKLTKKAADDADGPGN